MFESLNRITQGFGVEPYDINNGYCEDWANRVFGELRTTEHHVEVWETLFGISDTSHVFVRIDGKFYDAECLEGVEDHMQLPIFARLYDETKVRQPVWVVDANRAIIKEDSRRDVTAEMVQEYNDMFGTDNEV